MNEACERQKCVPGVRRGWLGEMNALTPGIYEGETMTRAKDTDEDK